MNPVKMNPMKMNQVNWVDILGWNKDQIEDFRNTGFSFLREGSYQTALRFFEALVIIDSESSYDIQILGSLYMQLGEFEKSLSTFDRALTLDPKDNNTLLNKTKVLLMLNRKEEALALAKTLTRSPDLIIANDAAALLLAYH